MIKTVLNPWSKPCSNRVQNVPKIIKFPQFPSITAYDDDDDGDEEEDVFIGDIAEHYLRKFATMSGSDKTFSIAR